MLLSFIPTIIGPIYVFLTQGIKTTIVCCKFPFIEENSSTEFTANMLLQSLMSLCGVFGYSSIEVCVNLYGDVFSIFSKIVRHEIKEMNNLRKPKQINNLQMHLLFRNIIQKSIDVERYVHLDFILNTKLNI